MKPKSRHFGTKIILYHSYNLSERDKRMNIINT